MSAEKVEAFGVFVSEAAFGIIEDLLVIAIVGVALGAEWEEEVVAGWFSCSLSVALVNVLSWDWYASRIEIEIVFSWLVHEWM